LQRMFTILPRVVILSATILTACTSTNSQTILSATSAEATTPTADSSAILNKGEIDGLRSQIAACWYIDPNASLPSDPIVEVHVELLPNGTVQSANVVDQARMASDADYRSAAQAALRAVLKCSPYKLPGDKYQYWKSIFFTFNFRGLVAN
jgi:hypothetical protein